MAIAVDTTTDGGFNGSTTTLTWSHTTAGSDRVLLVAVQTTSGDLVTGATYNTVAMTQINKAVAPSSTTNIYLFYLIAPTTGAHDVVVTASATSALAGLSASYTGCDQASQPDSQTTATAANPATSLTASTTVVASNCWLVSVFVNTASFAAAGTNTTERIEHSAVGFGIYDSNGTVSTGSQSLQATGSTADWAAVIASLDPAAAPPQKITELAALTDPQTGDYLVLADDPGGTAINKRLTIASLISTFGLFTNVVVQTKTVGSGTYTPTTGMVKVLGIAVGGGGAGAGGVNTDSAGGGGGGGGTVIRLMTAANIGASKAYVVGAAAAATTLDTAGALLNAGAGGAGTAGSVFSVVGVTTAGGTGGTAANGDLNMPGQAGERGVIYSATDGHGGDGGNSVFGAGAASGGTGIAGSTGGEYGGGGGGGHAASASDRAGGAGAPGILYLIEFLSV